MIYVVKTGDSLYSIAKTFGTNAATLASINELSDPDVLVVGQALVLPSTPSPTRPLIETNLYVEWYTDIPSENVVQQVEKNAALLTYMMPFAFEVKRDGSLTSMNWGRLPVVAKTNRVEAVIVLVNIEDGAFSDTLAHTIFTNEEIKREYLRKQWLKQQKEAQNIFILALNILMEQTEKTM